MDVWNEMEVLAELVDQIERIEPVRLDLCEPCTGPAVYVWSWCSERPTHGRRHLDLYADYLRPTQWPVYIGSAKRASSRRRRHLNTIADVRDIVPQDIAVAVLPLPSHAAALYAEALLIGDLAYRPLFNQHWMSGLGSSRDQGRNRVGQRRSAFATVHGRRRCGSGQPLRSYDELLNRIEEHLAGTVGPKRLAARS